MAKRRNGNPKTADGFIRISNELWDAWMCSRFTAREERMIKVVIRFSNPPNQNHGHKSGYNLRIHGHNYGHNFGFKGEEVVG